MGLDMYLERRHYVQRWDHIPEEQQFSVEVTRGGKDYALIQPGRIKYVIEEVACWRKANAIHRWFVSNVQNGDDDCKEYGVDRAQLWALLHDVEAALASDDPASILPTEHGFFFGSTAYDEGYRDDLRETVRQIAPLLAEPDSGYADYYYRASW